jgi:hypothetical protein
LPTSDFRRYTFGRFFATLVWQMLGVAVGWQVYSITRDPLDLGLIGLAQFLPFFALVLPGGQLADRKDRRLVMVVAYLIAAVCVAVLIGFSWSGSRDVSWVFMAMALFGAGRALWMPAGQAMVVNLVPANVFPAAVAFNSTLFETAVIGGPALGGLLYALGESRLQISGALLVYSVGFVLLSVAIVLIGGIRPRPAAHNPNPVGLASSSPRGCGSCFDAVPVLGAISLDLFAVLFGGRDGAVAGVCRRHPQGWPRSASACCVRHRCRRSDHGDLAGAAADRPPCPASGCSAVSRCSAARPCCSVCRPRSGCLRLHCFAWVSATWSRCFVRHLLVQLETPDAIRGRVSAVSAMFIGASRRTRRVRVRTHRRLAGSGARGHRGWRRLPRGGRCLPESVS